MRTEIRTHKTMDEVAGMRLELEGKKMLTIGTEHLELYDPITTKSAGMSCIPLRSASSKTQLIPLYNVLWAKVSNNQIIIDFVLHASRTLIEPSNLTIPLAPTDSNGPGGSFAETFARAILARAYREAKSRKRAYVLINPNSGPGGAIRLWKNEVKPIFDAARMELDVVILSHGGEAAELAEKADLSKYDTIMACSGDGTPHEIFNGLGNRFDASHALASMPASFAALAIVKGIVAPIDLVSVTHGSKRILSFLSQTVGMIAESDLGTEHLRWMGSNRFEWGVLTRVFNRTCYPCDLAVKVEIEEKAGIKAHYRRHASNASLARVASGDSTKASLTADLGLPELKYGTVQSPLPEGWELVSEDSIGIFYAGNMAYMGPNVNFFPASIISDGLMDLVTVDGDLSPVTAIRVMLKTDSPKFFDNPHVKYKKISAYRIIPRNQDDGFISIDGERIPFGPFQAEIHPGLGRVISKDGKYEAEGPANWDKVTVADRVYA